MRSRALESGRIYIRQHPEDARLTMEELHQLVDPVAFLNHVIHYAATFRGTCLYWMRQRTRLISMVNQLGMPTIFLPIALQTSSGLSLPSLSLQHQKIERLILML